MKILIAPDSFKDALSAIAVSAAIERGIKLANPQIETEKFPLADGGEGTIEVLNFHHQGTIETIKVSDPLGRQIEAKYGLSGDGQQAYIEMAQASGLERLSPAERNCCDTTTYGTGELILAAIKRGAKKIVLGIGGSATNDAGMGMATALGYRFLDRNGDRLEPTGRNLIKVSAIDDSQLQFDRSSIIVEVACDVDNPLYGERGAAYVYARQKGANHQEIEELDRGLQHFADVVNCWCGRDLSSIEGAGAAGGMGFGSMVFLTASLKPGIQLLMELTQFEEKLKSVDLVITGEGKIDEQTLHGKLIKGVTETTKKYTIPVIAFCGTLATTTEQIKSLGLTAAFSIIRQPMSLEEAKKDTAFGLENLAFNVIRVISK
ncbi:MAG: glycerate kinase [Cyanosarcina radialis HA8281-LM2]|nr:glycerate kinase [Cyanosarcina radialis HA8281-LM2]